MRISRTRKPVKMRVLGIDPAASGPTGYGVVETDGGTCRSVHYGATRPAKRHADFGARLREIHALIKRLVA